MKVLVTGATGFIGSHALAALQRAGHTVRAFVRSPQKLDHTIALHGLDPEGIEVATGDIVDPASVDRALEGTDALVHIAAVFSLDPNDEEEMARVNPQSTDLLLTRGRALGLDPLVYVSTSGVFTPPPSAHVTGDGPLGDGCGPYTRSKIAAEEIARRHQREGAPVVSLYPGAVLGPLDPNAELSDSMGAMRDLLQGRLPALPAPAPLPAIDVRDVGALIAAAMTRGRGPRHYLFSGHSLDLRDDILPHVNALTGRDLSCWTLPHGLLHVSARLVDFVARTTGVGLPVSAESLAILLAGSENPDVVFDQTPAREDFDLPAIAVQDTLRDTIAWLYEAGHLTRDQAGALAT